MKDTNIIFFSLSGHLKIHLTPIWNQILPNTRHLENMIFGDTDQNFESIQMSKNRSKSQTILNILRRYIEINGPVISSENRDIGHVRSCSL